MRTTSTIVAGAACKVTEPLNAEYADPIIYVVAADDTLTALAPMGVDGYFVIACENEAQADHARTEIAKREDMRFTGNQSDRPEDTFRFAYRIIPFRLLGRRWLEDWREVSDRIEVREGGSGATYMAVIIDDSTIAEKRVAVGKRDDVARELAGLRGRYPGLYLFDFRT